MIGKFPEIDYLVLGHITADVGENSRMLGGTASYAARTANAFGLRVGVFTSTQVDEPLLSNISQSASIYNIAANHTTTFENVYQGAKRHQFVRHVAGQLIVDEIPDSWLNTSIVHLAPLVNEIDPHEVVEKFPHALKLLTLQGLLRQWDDRGLVRYKRWFDADILTQIDYVIFSEDDIATDPQIEHEIVAVAPCVIVTRAERGGTIYRQGKIETYASPRVNVVNPTGAGDVFAAALLSTLHLRDGNLSDAVNVAAKLAANCVARFGLDGVPRIDEVRTVLAAV
jgi:sugar/nucleoside kinase (ribokinase family)